jgi:hypothetical protein
VIKAITYQSKQLLMTGLLNTIFVYMYSSYGYFYISETFYNYSIGDHGENMCVTMFQCFTTIFSLGMRSSGGIGDMLIRISWISTERELYFIRYVFDTTCFVIINIILMNIIFGIIIDTFKELRELKKMRDFEKTNFCFICSIEKPIFDKVQVNGFINHIAKDHNAWNYLYYIYFLIRKEETEYNGIESFVYKNYLEEDMAWFPIGRAVILEGDSDMAEGGIQERLSTLYDQLRRHNDEYEKIQAD